MEDVRKDEKIFNAVITIHTPRMRQRIHWSHRSMQLRCVLLVTALTDILPTDCQSLTVVPETQTGFKSHLCCFLALQLGARN